MMARVSFKVVVVIAVAVVLLLGAAQATYRKPPFNGSIFGKRANQAVSEYEQAQQAAGATKALSSLCEAVAESCAVWFPSAEASI